jgi:uncharacterized UPF0160 family protein
MEYVDCVSAVTSERQALSLLATGAGPLDAELAPVSGTPNGMFVRCGHFIAAARSSPFLDVFFPSI